jgi:hypothetical protein
MPTFLYSLHGLQAFHELAISQIVSISVLYQDLCSPQCREEQFVCEAMVGRSDTP